MPSDKVGSTVIIVANHPRFFRELLYRALATAPEDFNVMEIADEGQLAKSVKGQQADWIIVTSEESKSLPSAAESLLATQPALSAVGVSADGARVEVHTTGKEGRTRQDYHNISLAQLISVLAAHPHPASS